ncbi:MAG: hypothetical protein ACKVS8_03215 [Phycisphaerales bacterium]
MALSPPTSEPNLPSLAPLGVALALCAALGSAGAYATSLAAGWGPAPAASSAVVLAALVVLAGIITGLTLLALVLARGASIFAAAVIAAGIARTLISLSLGVVVLFTIAPEGKAFWSAFLAANLLCLFAETAWGIAVNQRVHRVSHPARTGAAA